MAPRTCRMPLTQNSRTRQVSVRVVEGALGPPGSCWWEGDKWSDCAPHGAQYQTGHFRPPNNEFENDSSVKEQVQGLSSLPIKLQMDSEIRPLAYLRAKGALGISLNTHHAGKVSARSRKPPIAPQVGVRHPALHEPYYTHT